MNILLVVSILLLTSLASAQDDADCLCLPDPYPVFFSAAPTVEAVRSDHMWLGGQAQLQLPLDRVSRSFFEFGIEYRHEQHNATAFAEYAYSFVESPAPVGPFVSVGLGVGVADPWSIEPAFDLRAGTGFSILVTAHFALRPTLEYRR